MKKIIIQKTPTPEHIEALARKVRRRSKIKAVIAKIIDIAYRGLRPRY